MTNVPLNMTARSWQNLQQKRAKFSFNIFRWVNRHVMLKWSYAHKVQSYSVWVYICSYVHFIKALKYKLNLLILFCILCLNLFGCWVRRLKYTKHFIYSIYSLAAVPARSQVVFPSKRQHVSPKACQNGIHYISHLMDGDSSNPGYLQGSLSSNWATHQLSLSILPYRLHRPGGGYRAHGNLFRNQTRS